VNELPTVPAPAKIARRLPKRMAQLEGAAAQFEPGRDYSETEVNIILMQLFEDHVFARRLLIEWGFLDRVADGTRYWLKPKSL
jgi:hypothetical protein